MTLPIGGADTSSRSTSESPRSGRCGGGRTRTPPPVVEERHALCSGYAMEQRASPSAVIDRLGIPADLKQLRIPADAARPPGARHRRGSAPQRSRLRKQPKRERHPRRTPAVPKSAERATLRLLVADDIDCHDENGRLRSQRVLRSPREPKEPLRDSAAGCARRLFLLQLAADLAGGEVRRMDVAVVARWIGRDRGELRRRQRSAVEGGDARRNRARRCRRGVASGMATGPAPCAIRRGYGRRRAPVRGLTSSV